MKLETKWAQREREREGGGEIERFRREELSASIRESNVHMHGLYDYKCNEELFDEI